jgi:hypothetical protein
VYEQRYRKYNEHNDIIISHISPINDRLVETAVGWIMLAKGEQSAYVALTTALSTIVEDSLQRVDGNDTVNILNWGLQEKFLDAEKARMSDYGPIIPMMFKSLENTEHYREVAGLLYKKAS